METLPISQNEISIFFLILARISAILVMLPFFNARVVPVYVKAGTSLVMAIVLFPVLSHESIIIPDTIWNLARVLICEFVIGLIMGLMVQIFFEGVRLMGQVVGFQTGFAIANILDPSSGAQVSILANMAYFVTLVLFLAFNGHHILLHALRESFDIIELGSLGLGPSAFHTLIQKSGDIFITAIKIGAPAMAALLFTKVAFGLITKLIPQMNIMIVAFPVQIIVGLMFFGLCLAVLASTMQDYLKDLGNTLMNMMMLIRA